MSVSRSTTTNGRKASKRRTNSAAKRKARKPPTPEEADVPADPKRAWTFAEGELEELHRALFVLSNALDGKHSCHDWDDLAMYVLDLAHGARSGAQTTRLIATGQLPPATHAAGVSS